MNLLVILVIIAIVYFIFIAPNKNKGVQTTPPPKQTTLQPINQILEQKKQSNLQEPPPEITEKQILERQKQKIEKQIRNNNKR